jgi:hypothetical protein
MSESSSESNPPDDDQLISDDQLPDDLNPDENPLARDPDDERNQQESDSGPGSGDAATGSDAAGGMPDAGQPG